jgi:hypothetical protein
MEDLWIILSESTLEILLLLLKQLSQLHKLKKPNQTCLSDSSLEKDFAIKSQTIINYFSEIVSLSLK